MGLNAPINFLLEPVVDHKKMVCGCGDHKSGRCGYLEMSGDFSKIGHFDPGNSTMVLSILRRSKTRSPSVFPGLVSSKEPTFCCMSLNRS
jgi:hypothetical protein